VAFDKMMHLRSFNIYYIIVSFLSGFFINLLIWHLSRPSYKNLYIIIYGFLYHAGKVNEIKVLHVAGHLGLNTFGDTPLRFDKWKDITVQFKLLDELYLDNPLEFIKCNTEA